MSFVARAHRFIAASPDACMARLRDFASWSGWMPASFRPHRGPAGLLLPGDVFSARIRGAPGVQSLRVEEYTPGHILSWSGGIPSVLRAIHTFRFETDANGSQVHSEEVWSGALSEVGFVSRRVLAAAEQVGGEQLDALARSLQG